MGYVEPMKAISQTTLSERDANVAIICLDGGVSLYADTLRFVEWKLHHAGVSVIRFGCDGALKTCTSINAEGKKEVSDVEREQICQRCKRAQQSIHAPVVFEVNSQDDGLLSAEACLFLDELNRRLGLAGKISNVLDMSFADLPICRIAFFDFATVNKLGPESKLDAKKMQRFVDGVVDIIKLIHAFGRFQKEHVASHIIYVIGNYSQNTVARYVFEKQGSTCLSVEPQLTSQHILNRVMIVPQRLILKPDGLLSADLHNLSFKSESAINISKVLKNFGARIKGADFNAYTSLDAKAIQQEELRMLSTLFNTHKRVHSFFLSSEDELTPHIITHGVVSITSSNLLGSYSNQLEFTEHLLNEAANHPEIGYVIRLHPRMGVNKRDRFESEESVRYKNLIAKKNIPKNVAILYGDSKISSYFIVIKSDLVIISWSTIGLEALLLGIPVIAAFPSYLMYPLLSFSKQPTNIIEMNQALFEKSDFGVPNDTKLMLWMGMAFEGQFFATTAPRGKGGLIGYAYRVIYKVIKKLGIYRWLARLINSLYLTQVIFNYERLFDMKKEPLPENTSSNTDLVRNYRARYRKILADYGQKIFIGRPQ